MFSKLAMKIHPWLTFSCILIVNFESQYNIQDIDLMLLLTTLNKY